MSDGLFNPEAFEQMPGQMSMAADEKPFVSMLGTEYAGYDVVDRMSGKIISGPYPRYVDAFNAAREAGRLAGVRER